jgi:hypothetical protein
MEPDSTVQVPATDPVATGFAEAALVAVLVGVLPDVFPGDSDSAAGVLLKKWM